MHVHGFGPFLFDRVIDNATSGVIVSLHWGGGLGMAQFLQSNANRADVLGIEEQCSKFSFSGTGNNLAHDLAKDMYGTIVGGWGSSVCGGSEWARTQEQITSSARMTFGRSEVGGITVCPEHHVTCMKMDGGIRVGCTVIEQLGEGMEGSLGAICLL